MTKAYSYIRMSTDKQSQGDSQRRQQTRAAEYCQQQGLELDTTLQLTDIGYSAYTGDHIETGAFGRFLDKVRTGQIERGSYLLIESHDRYSRMEPAKALPIFLDLLNHGIVIAVLSEGKVFHPGQINEMDIMMALFGLSRSHDESARKSDRLKRVWEHKRSTASKKALTRLAPGWLKMKPDRSGYDLIPERADVVRLMFDWAYRDGLGSYAIATELNRRQIKNFGPGKQGWQKSSVQKILNSRAVIGEFEPQTKQGRVRRPTGQILKDYFPAIIEPDVFHALQHRRTAKALGGGGRKGQGMPNLFSKIARCGYCGGPMHFVDKKERGGKYLFCDRAKRGLPCQVIYWPYPDFEASVLTFVTEIDLRSITSDFIHSDELALNRRELEAARGRLQGAEERRSKLLDLLTGEQATDYLKQRYQEADQQVAHHLADIDRLQERLNLLKNENRSFEDANRTIDDLVTANQIAPESASILRHRLHAAIKELVTGIFLFGHGVIKPVTWPEDQSLGDPKDDSQLQRLARHVRFVEQGSPERRFFRVSFRDGNIRTVKPHLTDPTVFESLGDSDYAPITRRQLEEMARVWGYDPTNKDDLEKAFIKLREMARTAMSRDKEEYAHYQKRAAPRTTMDTE